MIVVSHEMSFAREAADRVVFLDAGRILEEGPPERILSHPEHDEVRRFLRRLQAPDRPRIGA
jgi:polar amino acid transport system ATP-binding protein